MKQLFSILILLAASPAFGQFDPAGGEPGSLAIHKDDARFVRWCDSSKVSFGYYDISDKDSGRVSGGDHADIYGIPDMRTVSLGDSGSLICYFSKPIANIEGPDFVIFENGFKWFGGYFLELAFVEVSSNGTDFYRFPSESLADTQKQYTNNAAMDPTDYHNLAGKHQAPYGTPFDLEELKDSTGLDLQSVKYIRLVDVVGSLDSAYSSRDSKGRKINDPWPTAFDIGGFDLDAIGILGKISTGIPDNRVPDISIAPNPCSVGSSIRFTASSNLNTILIFDATTGQEIADLGEGRPWTPDRPGVYFAIFETNNEKTIRRICVY